MSAQDLANPEAARVDDAAVERRKAQRKQLDAPKGPTTWLMFPEDLCIAGIDYPADMKDPFYDERVNLPLDDGLIHDIDVNGVKQPLTVVNDGELPKVDNGRRRALHARAANRRRVERGEPRLQVKVFLEKGDAKHIFLTARRSNAYAVVDGVLQRARNAQRAINDFQSSVEEVASAEGVTPKAVKDWLAVLELGVDARQAIEAGRISARAALVLLGNVSRKDQAKVLAAELERVEAAGGKKVTMRDAEAGAKNQKRRRNPELPEGGKPKPDAAPAPKKSLVKKVIRAYESGDLVLFDETPKSRPLTEAFILALRYREGDITARGVKGLSPALTKMGL